MPIRNATPDDFDAVQALYRQLLEYEANDLNHDVKPDFAETDYGIECLRGFVTDNVGTMAIVYEDTDGVVKGYASLRDVPALEIAHKNTEKQCEIETLCVDQSCRDQGIGKQLIAECKRIAIENGYTNLKIVTLVNNDRAKNLYESCGFNEREVIYELDL